MSIYAKLKEMPRECTECIFLTGYIDPEDFTRCSLSDDADVSQFARPYNCPLIETTAPIEDIVAENEALKRQEEKNRKNNVVGQMPSNMSIFTQRTKINKS